MKQLLLICISLVGFSLPLYADGEGDNDPTVVRQVPRTGVNVSVEDTKRMRAELEKLSNQLQALRDSSQSLAMELIPDVEIYYRGVQDNLNHREFFSNGDIQKAFKLLSVGQQRAAELLNGNAPWLKQTGLVVRGYRSRLDGSAQPYGLVIPVNYSAELQRQMRLDIWFHGRGETLSETNFIDQRTKTTGYYSPANTIVLHPYGRYSNAFKFAGEVDVLEALAHAKSQYQVDSNRISVRGFSMGGAACWQFAVLYSDRWFAANPGAGFSETPEFLKFFQKEKLTPYWWEEKLWRWYDADDSAINLFHAPTVAYSGEKDIQKQAADVMELALAKEGISMVHIIGPDSGHRIHVDSQKVIEEKMASLAKTGNEIVPTTVHKITYSLKYNRQYWLTIDALTEHWEAARVDAKIVGPSSFEITSTGTTGLSFTMDPGFCPFDITRPVQLTINEEEVSLPGPNSDRSWKASVHLAGSKWVVGKTAVEGLVKKHGLQGPIDDAFMDSFLMVSPTTESMNPVIGEWVVREQQHAIDHWRQHFRGHARVKKDTDVTPEDIANHHLILWGDFSSNQLLKRIREDLPLQWTNEKVQIGSKSFPSVSHVPILIYPNPLNPEKYIVINSGFTYREYAYLNNARQVPMLPDWAIVDVVTPPHANESIYRFPGIPVDANFFNEAWQVK
jgi:pimeloyl-ACP methyl ester carboxylesterase